MKKILAALLIAVFALSLASCGKKDSKTITVGATPVPHAEILEVCKEILAKEGITLVIKEFDDYVIPNTSTEDGSLDANFFQHTVENATEGKLVLDGSLGYEGIVNEPIHIEFVHGRLQTSDTHDDARRLVNYIESFEDETMWMNGEFGIGGS